MRIGTLGALVLWNLQDFDSRSKTKITINVIDTNYDNDINNNMEQL